MLYHMAEDLTPSPIAGTWPTSGPTTSTDTTAAFTVDRATKQLVQMAAQASTIRGVYGDG